MQSVAIAVARGISEAGATCVARTLNVRPCIYTTDDITTIATVRLPHTLSHEFFIHVIHALMLLIGNMEHVQSKLSRFIRIRHLNLTSTFSTFMFNLRSQAWESCVRLVFRTCGAVAAPLASVGFACIVCSA